MEWDNHTVFRRLNRANSLLLAELSVGPCADAFWFERMNLFTKATQPITKRILDVCVCVCVSVFGRCFHCRYVQVCSYMFALCWHGFVRKQGASNLMVWGWVFPNLNSSFGSLEFFLLRSIPNPWSRWFTMIFWDPCLVITGMPCCCFFPTGWRDASESTRYWKTRLSIHFMPWSNWLLRKQILIWLVVWNMNFIFPEILGMSSSQLTFIFFRGVAQPPTSHDLLWS